MSFPRLLILLVLAGCGSNHVADDSAPAQQPEGKTSNAGPTVAPSTPSSFSYQGKSIYYSCYRGTKIKLVDPDHPSQIIEKDCVDSTQNVHPLIDISPYTHVICPSAGYNPGTVQYQLGENRNYTYQQRCEKGKPVALDPRGGEWQILCPQSRTYAYGKLGFLSMTITYTPADCAQDVLTKVAVYQNTLEDYVFFCPAQGFLEYRYSHWENKPNKNDGPFKRIDCTHNSVQPELSEKVYIRTLVPDAQNTLPFPVSV